MADTLRALPFRALRYGLRAASRAGGGVVDRVLRGSEAPPFSSGERQRVADPREPVAITIGGRSVNAVAGATLLEAAHVAGIDMRSYCGGNCSCGTCRIEVRAGGDRLSRRGSLEEMVLGSEASRRGDRLACQAQVLGPVDIAVPEFF